MKNKITRKTVLWKAITTYGEREQLRMMIEEMSELTKAICKYWRAPVGSEKEQKAIRNIREEAADVQIMLDQVKLMFGGIKPFERYKLRRLWRNLKKREKNGEQEDE